MSQLIVDSALEVAKRFEHAAVQNEEMHGDWRSPQPPKPFGGIDLGPTTEYRIEEVEREIRDKRRALSETVTDEQRQLSTRARHARQNPDFVPEGEHDAAKKALRDSLTDEQRQLRREISRQRHTVDRLDLEQMRRDSGFNDKAVLSASLPPRLSKGEQVAVGRILKAAADAGVGKEKVDFGRYSDDGMIKWMENDQTRLHPRDLPSLVEFIRPIISSPNRWQRVKVPNTPSNPKGEGFMITGEYPDAGLAYQVADALTSFGAVEKGERRELFKPDARNPKTRSLVLTGETAEKVMEFIGVDKDKIKPASHQRGG